MFADTHHALREAVRVQDLQGRFLRSGPPQTDRDAHLLQAGHIGNIGAAAGRQVNRLAVHARDRPQFPERLLAPEGFFGARCEIEDRRSDNGGIEKAGADRPHIGDGSRRRPCHRDETGDATRQAALAAQASRRAADGGGQTLADREVLAADDAGADLEESDLVRLLLKAYRRVPVKDRGKSGDQREGQRYQQRAGGYPRQRGSQHDRHFAHSFRLFPEIHGPLPVPPGYAKPATSFDSYN